MTTDIAPLAGVLEGIDDAHGEAEGVLAACALGLVTELSNEVRQLKEALDSNRHIGMAMGLVMGQLQVTDEEAFDALRRISQNTNRKLRDIAEDVMGVKQVHNRLRVDQGRRETAEGGGLDLSPSSISTTGATSSQQHGTNGRDGGTTSSGSPRR